MKLYVFTYLSAENEVKNTGLVRADDFVKGAATIGIAGPTLQVIGMSLVPAKKETEFFSMVLNNGGLRLNQKASGVFRWPQEGADK